MGIAERDDVAMAFKMGCRRGHIFSANVRSHRHRTAGATDAGSEATKHPACQRVGVRWTAWFDLFVFYCGDKLYYNLVRDLSAVGKADVKMVLIVIGWDEGCKCLPVGSRDGLR